MKIIVIGFWDHNGNPREWATIGEGKVLELFADGTVQVNGVEIVEWTMARQYAMGLRS